jgi:HAMP domain-containing protein
MRKEPFRQRHIVSCAGNPRFPPLGAARPWSRSVEVPELNARSLKHLFLTTTLKQELSSCLIPVPVLSYFAFAALSYARQNGPLFFTLASISTLASLLLGVLINYTAMRPVLRCIKEMRQGSAPAARIERARGNAYRFPAIHAVGVLSLWIFIPNLVILVPFLARHSVSNVEIIATVALDLLTGIGSMPLIYLLAEQARGRFLALPEMSGSSSAAEGGKRIGLSRKIVLVLFSVVLYPTGILTLLILLSNAGAIELKSATLGVVLLILATLAMSSIASLLMARSITRPLGEAAEAARKISEGDLDSRIPVLSRDEVGLLSGGIKMMSDNNVNELTQAAASAAEQMSGATERLSSMALQLQEATARFRLADEEARDLPNAALRTAAKGR